MEERCELGEDFSTYKKPLYEAFVKYSRDAGHLKTISHSRFTRRLREHGLVDDRDRTGRKDFVCFNKSLHSTDLPH